MLGAPQIPADHMAYPNAMCLNCHARPGGSFAQLYAGFVPVAIALIFGISRTFKRVGMRHLIGDLVQRKDTT